MHRLLTVITGLLMTLASYGVNAEGNVSEATAFNTDALYHYIYIEAVRQQDKGDYGTAFELFRRCLEMKPEAPEANYHMAVFYLATKKDSLGMRHLRKAVALEPHNTEFAERLAQTYLMQNKVAEAAEVYENLVAQTPERTDYLELLTRIYENQRDYKKMLSALDRIETQEGQSEDLTLTKMQAYSFLGDAEGAYRELKGLTDAHPNDMNLQVMLGNWLFSNGRKEEAKETFDRVLREDPNNAAGQMSMMDFYRAQGETERVDTLIYKMLVNPLTEPETRVTLLREYVRDSEEKGGDSLKVMQLFDRVLALPQKTSEVAETKVAYMALKQAPRDSIRAGWERVLEITPEYVSARLHLIQMMWEDTIDENVIKQCRLATEYVPDEPVLYFHLALAQYVCKHDEDAVASLRRGIANITTETGTNICADMYELLGDILQKMHRRQEAYVAYDSCLVYDPNKVVCLNNYAYFLSLENQNLKKAEEMSMRAITAEPNSSTYLDTYAWILYRQKKYEEARTYIEKALAVEEDSVESPADILEHAGDIYFRLNLREKAVEMWERALKAGPENEATLRKKIAKKKL